MTVTKRCDDQAVWVGEHVYDPTETRFNTVYDSAATAGTPLLNSSVAEISMDVPLFGHYPIRNYRSPSHQVQLSKYAYELSIGPFFVDTSVSTKRESGMAGDRKVYPTQLGELVWAVCKPGELSREFDPLYRERLPIGEIRSH
jgi:hypothetical protein